MKKIIICLIIALGFFSILEGLQEAKADAGALNDCSGVQYASVTVAAGTNTIVTAVSGKKVRILHYFLTASATSTVQFQSTAATALTGAMVAGTVKDVACSSPYGCMQSASGTGVQLVAVGGGFTGHVTYALCS